MEPLCEEWTLATLRHHWGSAYDICQHGPESWTATRRDGKGEVRAASADDLVKGIRADYGTRPVPRQGKAED